MEMQMVDAKKMQISIEETGRVALYGIYFDRDSARSVGTNAGQDRQAAYVATGAEGHRVGPHGLCGGFDYSMDLSRRRA
ncbi:MAG: hypothetical protein LJE84_12650 [Gammaproteobacteria bacterium]|jgi:hypothetical protein|nr:hypothetical protein [Gammaproteobacteria bacterium]